MIIALGLLGFATWFVLFMVFALPPGPKRAPRWPKNRRNRK